MKTKFEQIVNVDEVGKNSATRNMYEVLALAEKEKCEASEKDKVKRLLLIIDNQFDFISEEGSMTVPGAIADEKRLLHFIYKNMEHITEIVNSLDTHRPYQIFHPAFWVNEEGEHPAPYTIIKSEDLKTGKWKVTVADHYKTLESLEKLQEAGKELCIWPFHCIEGTEGANLEYQLAKMVYFHQIVRKADNEMIRKGMDPYSEMYGIIEPEVVINTEDEINWELIIQLMNYDEIYIAGQAASHCLKDSVKQIVKNISRRDFTEKITVLKDCTSCITGFEEQTEEAFAILKEQYGIKFAKSTDITFED